MLSRDAARRFGRQTRLAGVGEAGQVKLCAEKVSPSASGFAATIEARYLAAAGITVTGDPTDAKVIASDLPDLGVRHEAPYDVADGALRALVAIVATLREGR